MPVLPGQAGGPERLEMGRVEIILTGHDTAVGLPRSPRSLGVAAAPGRFGDIVARPWAT